ncbi:efflux RND transporter periplasmic adaptor subunit [Pseudoalteromonas sp. SSMSWG5]|jgi:HlyD family secretion protein|uniref:efflux RND transporter periplasmic adaptor subunit n=1 Tax=Pseudoalteromonas TaxID=53246 RepID=UPI000C66B4B3|nr:MULTISPECIES: efflux RND transporter periplasmic adaptor subunit [unclassified Pseudoalteromonas]MBD55907.1 efflux transporter periplasmic adaptor subunit [Pseudoalteromonas sp.]MCF2920154.1 efflux RND transporter periplasmic adaptor subunit [Pseudoalteromonas sp. APAL1]MCO7250982.1 efflux RND transporter periplasmic adaptor subunit [Pseudoalteromonas sp. Ps84H-4]TGV18741.1 efflux RND transporter periplasmic adaptor subunit [Pseudoalteromonas sp. MEBiC 03607]HCV05511.1 efflux transporter pe|tara:strand:- start:1119 stop:2285 length:1167 start_codon:yes stop_codon:yes gene_type:complete
MKKAIIIGLAVTAFVALLVSKQVTGNKDAPEMHIAEVEQGNIADSILASGNLVFNTQVQLRSEVTGRVAKVFVEEGESVTEGDILMRLDTTAFESEVARNKAVLRATEIDIKHSETRLKNIERQLSRQKELYEVGLAGQEVYENLQNARDLAKIDIEAKREAYNQAQASLLIAEDRLNKSVFRAPMSGLLASVNIKEGETVIAGTTNIIGSDLMLVADPSAILAELRVDETDIAGIKLDQHADIYAAAYPNQPFTGKVINIGTSAKNQAGSQGLSFKVKVLLDATDRQLYAGMSCRAEIATSIAENGLKLPIEAIQKEDDSYFVWKLNADNTVTKTAVTVGISSDIEQALTSGVAKGDRIVIGPARPLSSLKEGDTVAVKNSPEKGAS